MWLNAFFALAILCYFTGYETAAGILLGLMASIKPQKYALFIFWGLFRGNKRLVIAMIITGAVGLLLGIRVFGIAMYIDYFPRAEFSAQRGILLFQSILQWAGRANLRYSLSRNFQQHQIARDLFPALQYLDLCIYPNYHHRHPADRFD